MTLFTKTGNTLRIATSPEEDRITAVSSMHKKLVTMRRVISEMCSQTDEHTNTHRYVHHSNLLSYGRRSNLKQFKTNCTEKHFPVKSDQCKMMRLISVE